VKYISAGDASQIVRLVRRIERGIPAAEALSQLTIGDGFAKEIGRAMAGDDVSADARSAAHEIRELVGAASVSRPPSA
jgi:hypothetical protein